MVVDYKITVKGIPLVERKLYNVSKLPKTIKKTINSWGKEMSRRLKISVGMKHTWTGNLKSSIGWKSGSKGGSISMADYGLKLAGWKNAPKELRIRKNSKLAKWTRDRFLGHHIDKGQGSRVKWIKGRPVGVIRFKPDDFISRVLQGQNNVLLKKIRKDVSRRIK